MPPFAFQALLRAEARTQEAAQAFLQAAARAAAGLVAAPAVSTLPAGADGDPARGQCRTRADAGRDAVARALQRLLAAWQPVLHELRRQRSGEQRILRWAIDVDPLAI